MNTTLLTALAALVPASMLFTGSAALFIRRRQLSRLLQLLGAGGQVCQVASMPRRRKPGPDRPVLRGRAPGPLP